MIQAFEVMVNMNERYINIFVQLKKCHIHLNKKYKYKKIQFSVKQVKQMVQKDRGIA